MTVDRVLSLAVLFLAVAEIFHFLAYLHLQRQVERQRRLLLAVVAGVIVPARRGPQ